MRHGISVAAFGHAQFFGPVEGRVELSFKTAHHLCCLLLAQFLSATIFGFVLINAQERTRLVQSQAHREEIQASLKIARAIVFNWQKPRPLEVDCVSKKRAANYDVKENLQLPSEPS